MATYTYSHFTSELRAFRAYAREAGTLALGRIAAATYDLGAWIGGQWEGLNGAQCLISHAHGADEGRMLAGGDVLVAEAVSEFDGLWERHMCHHLESRRALLGYYRSATLDELHRRALLEDSARDADRRELDAAAARVATVEAREPVLC